LNPIDLPPQTAEIFDRLSRGQFISANSQDDRQAGLYVLLSAREEDFRAYFAPLGLDLQKGPGYFYLTRPDTRSALEDKAERMLRWIDWLDWLTRCYPQLAPGQRLELSALLEMTQQRAALRRQLRSLPLKGSLNSDEDRLLALLRTLEREGLAEQVSERPLAYRLLAALDYVIQLLQRIQPLE